MEPVLNTVTAMKHTELSNAIDEIDLVVLQANELLVRINGGGCGTEHNEPPRAVNSLSNVLASGAGDIRNKCQELKETLNNISDVLF